jgi:hypothetical protein
LNKVARKFPEHSFTNEAKFIKYFSLIVKQELKKPWQVNEKTYFTNPKKLSEINIAQLKKKGFKLDKTTKLLFEKLKRFNPNALFETKEAIISYLEEAKENQISKEDIKQAFKALPRASIKQMNNYLATVEASYRHVSPEQHLRRRIAAKIETKTAYRLLNVLKLFSTKIEEGLLFLPTTNLIYCNVLSRHVKTIILNEAKSIYGYSVEAIKFVATKPFVEYQKKINPESIVIVKRAKISNAKLDELVDEEIKNKHKEAEQCRIQLKTALPELSDEERETYIVIPSRETIRADILQKYQPIATDAC